MEKESPRQRLVEANSTGGQGSRRAVAPSDDDDDDDVRWTTGILTNADYTSVYDFSVR
jgi:hypothetical protein